MLQQQIPTQYHKIKDIFSNSEITKIKNQAFENFETIGFPNKKHEEWRFSNVQPIVNSEYTFSSESKKIENLNSIINRNLDSYKFVFINGIFNSTLSKIETNELDISTLSEAIKNNTYSEKIEQFLNKSQNNQEHFFSLNTSLFTDGAFVHVKKNSAISKPIEIINISNSENVAPITQPRNLIVIEDNAQVKIIEENKNIGSTSNLINSVSEVFLGQNSIVDYYKIQNDSLNTNLIDTTSITQKRDSVAKVHTFSFGGKFTRNNLNFYQKGENTNSILKGITLISNNQLVDHHTLVDHFVPNCESHELYKGIFDGNSQGVFNGKIIVDKEAQKTNAFQQNNNLLLSDDASINTKPQLEIFADDVKCSHGCTVGQLDEDAMFYLRSRGIPLKKAQSILTEAFCSDVLETVEIEEIKEIVSSEISRKLA
ncbi:MAG: Fe-S cluster assembly protein SufD [Flavobacteriales bacterium]|nr:Fe-S cluster assembly protein SufD [Flavobacteriales bacterium]